jgi:VWFA-related protein
MRPHLLFLLAACTIFAQQEPTIRLDVQQVLVPVIVTDKKGHHVEGLHSSDFHIYEDGVPQEINAFSSGTAASVDDITALSKPASAPAAESATPRRTFVICLDTLHTSSASVTRMRRALESLFAGEKPSDAQYVLIGIGRQMQVLQAATANPLAILMKIRGVAFERTMAGLDASAMAAELNNLRSRMDEYCKRCPCGVRANPRPCDSEIETLKQSVSAEAARWIAPTNALLEQFRNVVEELGKLPTSRTLILVSDGFNVNPARDFYALLSSYLPNLPQFEPGIIKGVIKGDTKNPEPLLQEASKIAADRNVTIYAVDSRSGSAPSLTSNGSMDAGSTGSPGGFQSVLGNSGPRGSAASVRTTTLQSDAGHQPGAAAFEQSAAMERLAHATGGVYFHEGNDILKQFKAALADGREYYVLAYAPKNSAQDGKFRRITVETTDKNLTLRAKAGYWAAGSPQ